MHLTNRLYSIDNNLIATSIAGAAPAVLLACDNWVSDVMGGSAHAFGGEVGVQGSSDKFDGVLPPTSRMGDDPLIGPRCDIDAKPV